MKIRKGFVSNSSSSSFVILTYHLSKEQIDKILNYVEVVEEYLKDNPLPEKGYYDYDQKPEFDFSYYDWGWGIQEINDYIFGETSMDNFDFSEFLRYIGIDNQDNIVCWDDGWNDEPTDTQETFLKRERVKLRKQKLDKLNSDEY